MEVRRPGWTEGEREKRCELAAFLQAVAVVFTSLALSDPAWLLVSVNGQESVYGVSYFLHHGFSLNSTEPVGGPRLLHKTGLYILALITFCCYNNILLGSVAFMIDFAAVCSRGIMGMKISSVLHGLTVISSGASVALCSYLYVMLYDEVKFLVAKPPANSVRLGDSYYFAISAFLASFSAAVRSCYYVQRYQREDRSEVPASHDEVTTPLLQHPESPDTPSFLPHDHAAQVT